MDLPSGSNINMDIPQLAALLAAAIGTIKVKTNGTMVITRKFDGKNITDFLENFELQTKINGLTDDQERCDWMIAHSQNTEAYSLVKACVEDKSWKDAKKELKEMFRIQNEKQMLNKAWRKNIRDQFRRMQRDIDTVSWSKFADRLKAMVEEEIIDDMNDRLTRSHNKTEVAKQIDSKGRVVDSSDSSYSSSDSEDTRKPFRKTRFTPIQSGRSKSKQAKTTKQVQKDDLDTLLQGFQELSIYQAKMEHVESAIDKIQQQLGQLIGSQQSFSRGERFTGTNIYTNTVQTRRLGTDQTQQRDQNTAPLYQSYRQSNCLYDRTS